jgi:hypothetical protein
LDFDFSNIFTQNREQNSASKFLINTFVVFVFWLLMLIFRSDENDFSTVAWLMSCCWPYLISLLKELVMAL